VGNVQLTLVGLLKKYGPAESSVTVESGRTVMEVIEELGLDPDLVAIVMVNGRQKFKSYRLQDGDSVKLVPMVGGG
jgi:thiamine biosynthesis protein ThiS